MADNEISGTENANGVPQLKPCPFCGGEAKTSNERFERTLLSWVYCTSCGSAGGYRNTEQDAIDAWNTRAERTCRMETEESCQNWNSCSECDADYYTDQPINYCPNCGAKVTE